MADYPASLHSAATIPATLGGTPNHEDVHDEIAAEIVAIETELGTNVAWRLLNSYASTAARDAEITAPANGHLAFVTADNHLYYYNNSAWWSISRQQSGQKSGTTDANGEISVTFTTAFVGTIRVFCQIVASGTTQLSGVVKTSSTTGFTFKVVEDGAVLDTGSVTFDWFAIED